MLVCRNHKVSHTIFTSNGKFYEKIIKALQQEIFQNWSVSKKKYPNRLSYSENVSSSKEVSTY